MKSIGVLPLVLLALASAAPNASGNRRAPSPDGDLSRTRSFLAEFDLGGALESAAFADGYSRAPGGPGYAAVVEHVLGELGRAGYGVHPGLALEVLETPLPSPAFDARAGRVILIDAAGQAVVLHEFGGPADVDRAIVPRNAPPVDLTAPAVFELTDVVPGTILVTESRVRPDLLRRASRRGAVAVVSASLATHNLDVGQGTSHLDAIQLRELPADTELPVLQISPASYAAIRAADAPRLALFADVAFGPPTARTVVARIDGALRADEAVVLVSHLQGAGASDAAAAAAGLLESARAAARLVRSGDVPRPCRSVVFVFGPERAQVRSWLASTDLVPVAAIDALGVGTGPLVLERAPDPAAPEVRAVPNAFSTIVRGAAGLVADCADARGADWCAREQAYEGGSSADVFLERGVPAVLLWSPPGRTSRTSLDRWQEIDGEELRRASVTGLVAAWSVADPDPEALARHLLSLESERRARIEDALGSRDPAAAEAWQRWFSGAAAWLAETS